MSIDRRRMLELTGGAAVGSATRSILALAGLDGQAALGTYAASLLGLIHGARDLGRPRNSPHFILHAGPVYVQALARSDGSPIQLEAVSERSDPAVAKYLSPAKLARLAELGFQIPGGRSPNHWRDVEVRQSKDLDRAGALAATVLSEVFGVSDLDALGVIVNVPGARGRRTAAPLLRVLSDQRRLVSKFMPC
jgi:hypothetical protein